ncbi:MAG: phosphohistidine phosphatase SixA [Rhodospirillales bacterium]|jgi:phosphohistidine phosphatase|nr:phosphohistidine phosphatase SixA [Rhodospirillales bacterium]MDP6804944.1 phosphohistidine phosphatase SixA [Rhodospirillales bacterium]
MKLYLVRHGDAVPESENPDRPLSEKGNADVRTIAAFIARSGGRVARVIHSGRARAHETAVLFADVIGPGKMVEEAESGLGPNEPTELLARVADAMEEDLMIVGHDPFMTRMISRLAADDENAGIVTLEPGSVACLERGADGGTWTINWIVGPTLLGR